MELIKRKSLKLNAFFNVIKTLMSLVFPLITFPYASRILLAEGIGKVNFANSIISYFSIIASLGISTYAIREAAKVRENRILLSKFVLEILIINLISTAISYLLLFISISIVPKFSENNILIIILSTNILLSTLGISWLYSVFEEYSYITIRTILFQFVSIILLFSFVKTKKDYTIYAIISVISNAGSNIFNIFHARKYLSFKNLPSLELKKHLKPIIILFSSSIAISIFTILDTSMLGFLSTDTEVGYYSAASKIIRMIRDLFPAVFTVLFVRLTIYTETNQEKEIIQLSKKTFCFILSLSIPASIGLYLLMPDIVRLMCGPTFSSAVSSARVMAPLLILSSCSGFMGGQLLLSLGKDKTYSWCMIGAAISDVLFNFLFIPIFHSFGAALATTITELIIFIVYCLILKKLLTIVFMEIRKELLKYFISSLLMAVIVIIIIKTINNMYIRLILSTVIGGLMYCIFLLIQKSEFLISAFPIVAKKIKIKTPS